MRIPIILGLMAAIAVPSIAQAQSAGELRHDDRQVAQSRRELRDALQRGDRRDIRDAQSQLRADWDERHQDWRDYRRSHRDVFRGPAYVGPRGYRYRPVTSGYRFQPMYYSSRYVIDDPHRYRLPRAEGARRWVRYGNDAVLVNTRNGRVIEVHQGFFG